MFDGYGREVTELRISVTSDCNLKCFFCHKEWDSSEGHTSAQEFLRIIETAKSCGFRRLKITGGEPLLRGDLPDIVRRASSILEEVSITTNGTLLSQRAPELKRAGLSRVNVNLPTIIDERYKRICGASMLREVIGGIRAARDQGFPTKVNMVVLRGVNEDEVGAMTDFASSLGAVLQLIELQPLPSGGNVFSRYHVDLNSLEKELRARAMRMTATHGGQRNRYAIRHNGSEASIEVVRPTGNPSFCRMCSKLRVTSDGKLKPCLLRSDNLVDIVGPLRSGVTDKGLIDVFKQASANREPYWKDGDRG